MENVSQNMFFSQNKEKSILYVADTTKRFYLILFGEFGVLSYFIHSFNWSYRRVTYLLKLYSTLVWNNPGEKN